MNANLQSASSTQYKPYLQQWNKFSSIRSRPRRSINDYSNNEYFYPLLRQPLCIHPLVKKRGDKIIKYILIQSAYRFMSDIAYVETEVINNVALKIFNKTFDFNFSEAMRHDALSIIVDEAYHAYVAIDFMKQIEEKTLIKPIYKTEETELSATLASYITRIPEHLENVFELIAICIGENTLTRELFSITKEQNVNKIFHDVMADHMIDEGRHSQIFCFIFKMVWAQLSDKDQLIIGALLPNFIKDYLDPKFHIQFDIQLLEHLNFKSEEIYKIIQDTHTEHKKENFKSINPIVGSITKMLKRSHIFDNVEIKNLFIKENII